MSSDSLEGNIISNSHPQRLVGSLLKLQTPGVSISILNFGGMARGIIGSWWLKFPEIPTPTSAC